MTIKHQGKILAASVLVAAGTLGYMIASEVDGTGRRQRGAVQVAQDSESRQKTLDELVKDPRLGNINDVVIEVVYDPGFRKYEKELGQLLDQGEKTNDLHLITRTRAKLDELQKKRTARSQGKGRAYATTQVDGDLRYVGRKSRIFLGEDLFDFAGNNDDVLIGVYHEKMHAELGKYGLPFVEDAGKEIALIFPDKKLSNEVMGDDGKLTQTFEEAYAFGKQLDAALDGTFKLSPGRTKEIEERYLSYRSELKKNMNGDTVRAKVAKAMYDSLPIKRED